MIGFGLCALIGFVAVLDRLDGLGGQRSSRPGPDHIRDVPDFLDIVTLALTCGSSAPESLTLGVRHGPSSIAGRLAPVVTAIDARLAFGSAVGAANLEAGDAVAVILDVLRQGHVEGSSVVGRLEYLGVDYRRMALSRDQAAARRLSVRVLFPMVLCMLPAFALLTVVPLLVGSLTAI